MKNKMGEKSDERFGLALALILLLGLLLRIFLASLDIKVLLPNLLSDDVFYYLKVAGNIASGVGASFDGITKTNGFHPLYAMFLAFLYSMNGFGLETPIRISLVILSVFDVLTGLVVYKIMLLPAFGSNRKSAFIACLFWVFNPFVISGTFYGLETAIATFFVSLSIYSYLKVRGTEADSKKYVSLGVFLGVAMLARMDSVFLAVAIAADLLVQKGTYKMLLTLAAVLIVSLPWFAWNYSNFGMIQQNSGAVLSYVSGFHAGSFLSYSYLQSKVNSLYLFLRILVMFLFSMILPLTFVLLLLLLKRIELRVNYRKLLLNFIVLFSILLVAYYPVLMGGVTRRYYQPLLVVSALVVGLISRQITLPENKKLKAIFVILLLVNLLIVGLFYWVYRPLSPQSWHLDLYEAALWISANTNPGDRVGGFNCGIVGYFSNRTVVNLDGVINDGAYHAIVDKELFKYIQNQKIKYLVDNQNSFDSMAPFMGDDNYKMKLKLVYKKPLREREDQYVVVYEVVE